MGSEETMKKRVKVLVVDSQSLSNTKLAQHMIAVVDVYLKQVYRISDGETALNWK